MAAKRALALAAAVALSGVTACKSAAPTKPASTASQDVVQSFVGKTLILRHRGDAKTINLKRTELASARGGCDVVVLVKTASFDKGTAALALETLGRPRLPRRGAHEEKCEDDQFHIAMNVSGFVAGVAGFDHGASAAELETTLSQLLKTPEAYLKAFRVPFEVAAASATAPVAEPRITTQPERLVWADAVFEDVSKKVRHEGEVEVEGVVGLDGRLYQPKVVTPLSPEHEKSVLRVVPLWRFQPGKRGNDPAPAKVRERMVLRILY
jgi:hypothetical protein